jgi:integrin beta 3
MTDATGQLGPAIVPPQRSRKSARAELRRQLQQVARLRAATLVMVVLIVVGAPVAFFVIREFTRDPVFLELDGLDVPSWAAGKHTDDAFGSRWCIGECRFRERTWESMRGPEETNRAYTAALKKAGWVSWQVDGCPAEGIEGFDSCWQRDEYVMDLWVREAVCEIKQTRPTVAASPAPASAPASASASAVPGATPTPPEPGCAVSLATVKVFNRISYRFSESG